jgi:hypothetical protein
VGGAPTARAAAAVSLGERAVSARRGGLAPAGGAVGRSLAAGPPLLDPLRRDALRRHRGRGQLRRVDQRAPGRPGPEPARRTLGAALGGRLRAARPDGAICRRSSPGSPRSRYGSLPFPGPGGGVRRTRSRRRTTRD